MVGSCLLLAVVATVSGDCDYQAIGDASRTNGLDQFIFEKIKEGKIDQSNIKSYAQKTKGKTIETYEQATDDNTLVKDRIRFEKDDWKSVPRKACETIERLQAERTRCKKILRISGTKREVYTNFAVNICHVFTEREKPLSNNN